MALQPSLSAPSRHSESDGVTVVNDHTYRSNGAASKQPALTKALYKPLPGSRTETVHLPFVDEASYLDTKRPFVVPIGTGGVVQALRELNTELVAAGHNSIISDKRPHNYVGREVNPGSFGVYEFASGPKLLLDPGRYPGLPLANWIGCDWRGTYDLATNFPPLGQGSGGLVADENIQRLGLTIVQVSQNQAAVCLDPQMRVFVISDRGFVAMATTGAYKVLGLIDQTHLSESVVDRYSKHVLGHTQSVRLPNKYVAATFLDIPANHAVVLQRGDEMFQLGAGQHFVTTPGVSLRGFFTMGEVQIELECDNVYTRDQVPVWLRLYLRYQLQQPLQLAQHGYPTPFDALQDKARSILTQIVAHLDYSTMARTRNAAPELQDGGDDDVGAVFVSAVRTQAIDELKVVASEYGIRLEDLAIIDRKFKGEIAAKLDSLTTRALEAQVESANLDRENANRALKQQGEARVLQLQNAMKRATVETDNMNAIARARAKAESLTIEAEAEATAIKLRAEAQAEATRIQARVDADIRDEFARNLAQGRLEVERTKAYGNGTVFAPMDALRSAGMVGMGMFGPRPMPAPASPGASGTVSRK
ncbi:hypothetical protein CcaverHIS002_0211890 [Cutaneotrichosporon cavernicola]|uniref:Band 7 domain-containing protein n=1 Tax=Cutaneotrichosporon cavernicola TaxID=279322 RepID=A0AA48I259_9TREE|nr:uncharacterized protein CcaverHIS019_0211910 [Cutaneotrichosporon cavernicola]BEI82029.1 hypothetical protein CcaverHIS002_0211890 [Cutaneotrichosporon cavernicola]BEI89829.1 hypothetical protein CcaverHIS019_0211910 [Cutaneotrichosporon cavernicola]BEI97599.1 hypothetical protein CcaverHIS631_0211880 [Cutaneotrichosporon cavernicola]BEJ05378.1 hypothetical protein CcaverHIS641_0211950 [Cutaneotrichosporon cavernicola]